MDDSLTTDGTERRERPAASREPVRRAGETPRQQIRKASPGAAGMSSDCQRCHLVVDSIAPGLRTAGTNGDPGCRFGSPATR